MEERVPLFLCKKEGQVLFCTRPSRPCEKSNNFIDCGSVQSFLDELRMHEPIKDLLIDVCIFQTLNFVDVLISIYSGCRRQWTTCQRIEKLFFKSQHSWVPDYKKKKGLK